MTTLMREIYYSPWLSPPEFREPYYSDNLYANYYGPPAFSLPGLATYSRHPEVPRSAKSVAVYGHYPKTPYVDSAPPARAASYSSPRETREPRPRNHKVHPEIELKVPMCCSKCETKARETLQRLDGVTSVTADKLNSKVTVTGKVDPQVVLKKAQKFKKKSEFFTSKIYSQAFIDFIQSKTGRSYNAEEEVTYSQHGSEHHDGGESHHQHHQEDTSSFVEHSPVREEEDEREEDVHHSYEDDTTCEPSSSAASPDTSVYDRDRGSYYNQYTPSYVTADVASYSSYRYPEAVSEDRDLQPRYEGYGGSAYYNDPYQHSYGSREQQESRSSPYEDCHPHQDYSSSYRSSQSYGYENPHYMKRVISDY